MSLTFGSSWGGAYCPGPPGNPYPGPPGKPYPGCPCPYPYNLLMTEFTVSSRVFFFCSYSSLVAFGLAPNHSRTSLVASETFFLSSSVILSLTYGSSIV